jgi:hypothetical protein
VKTQEDLARDILAWLEVDPGCDDWKVKDVEGMLSAWRDEAVEEYSADIRINTFIRCKIFENPEGYLNASPR